MWVMGIRVEFWIQVWQSNRVMERYRVKSRVRAVRKRLGLLQEDLAREVGVTRQTIIAIEQGRMMNPSIRTCLRLARLLQEPVDYLFYLEREEEPEDQAEPAAEREKKAPVKTENAPETVSEGGNLEPENRNPEPNRRTEDNNKREENETVTQAGDKPGEDEPEQAETPDNNREQEPATGSAPEWWASLSR